MSPVLLTACLALLGAGPAVSSTAPAPATVDEEPKIQVRVTDNRAALTRRYLELTTGGTDKLIQQVVNAEIAGMADDLPAEQLAWFRTNAVVIMRPHIDRLMQSMSDDTQTRFTEAELEALVRFYDTPQGRTIATKQMEQGGALGQAMQNFQMAYLTDLMTKFCGAFDCEAMAGNATGAAKPSKR